jgi:Acyl-CoA dehydrogenase, C-terminal domain
VDLELDADQQAVADLFSNFFTKECPSTLVREHEPLGFAPGLWQQLTALDLDALATDAGLFEAVLVGESAGTVLAPVPVAEHLAARRLLARLGVDPPSGDAPLTLALSTRDDRRVLVPAGAIARAVVTRHADAIGLAEGPAPGVAIPNTAGLPLAARALTDARVIAHGKSAVAEFERALDEWRLLLASMLTGLADAALTIGADYVRDRHQFGVPIGSFQAIQHGLAEFPGPLAASRLLVRRAAWRADQGEPTLTVDAPMAFLFATDLARRVSERSLHYHGGYGVMAEYDIQLYYRRARGWPAQLGDPEAEYERLGTLLDQRDA